MIKFKDTGKMPPLLADTGKKYTATIETEKGNLVLELFAKDVPRDGQQLCLSGDEGLL